MAWARMVSGVRDCPTARASHMGGAVTARHSALERIPALSPSLATRGAGRSHDGATTILPSDLLRDQLIRLQVFYVVGALLWAINIGMEEAFHPHGDRGPYHLPIELTGLALAVAAALFVRFSGVSDRRKEHAGVLLMLPHAFALALLNSWVELPTTMRSLSPVTVLILFFGMLAPASPGRMLTVSILAALMDPLGVWIAHLRGLPVPSLVSTFAMFYPNFVCAVLAVVPARVVYRLGKQLHDARDLGSYQLVERLGEGGMGEVWRAQHRLLARSAAIKLIRPGMLGQRGSDAAALTLGRFEREAQATAALTSPHTIRLFDFGLTDDDTFYYVMELLDGRDLETLVRDFGPLPADRAMHLMRQVCRSLAEAHAKGLVHRDIKPANIYVCRMGVEYDFVKVLDFGLVKWEDPEVATTLFTSGHVTMGTPAYMAPEVVLGNRDTDRRVDVYALGCVAYYLLTGCRVFDAPTPMKLLMQHVHEPPVPPSERTEQPIPRDLDDLVMACLEKDPSRRPADADELYRRICDCRMPVWEQVDARRWWEVHLPDLSRPLAASVPTWTQDRALALS
jgi:serine/threonine-protein kinase